MRFIVAADFEQEELTPEETEDELIVLMHFSLNHCKVYENDVFNALSDAIRFGMQKAKELKQAGEKVKRIRVIEERGDILGNTLSFDQEGKLSDIFYFDKATNMIVSLSARECYEIIFDWLNKYAVTDLEKRSIERNIIEKIAGAVAALPDPKTADPEEMCLVFDRVLSGKEDMPFEYFFSELGYYAKHAKC